MKIFSSYWLLILLALPCVITIFNSKSAFAYADEDAQEDLAEGEVSVEGGAEEEKTEEEEEDKPEDKTQGSSDIDLSLLFTNPIGDGMELPAGKPVEFLIGVTNNGDSEYIIDAADVSFRYPMDFTYTIQNFSAAVYNKVVKPKEETTVFYNFITSDSFAGRPLGFQINLAYHSPEGEDFLESVFNSTINVIELNEGLDGETFFLYVFLLAFVVLLLLAGHHALTSLGVGGSKKGPSRVTPSSKSDGVEVGTSNSNGVDYDWLPDQMKADLKKASNGSVKKQLGAPIRSSPRLRKP